MERAAAWMATMPTNIQDEESKGSTYKKRAKIESQALNREGLSILKLSSCP